MAQGAETYYKREFWASENLKYVEPHFRLTKAARIVNRLAGHKNCDLLDVGCGPATLARFVRTNINYHGIDIAIHNPAPNLLQTDFLTAPIQFADKKFDIIIAQGVFEYVGKFQAQKFGEIANIMKESGSFLASYVNFDHLHRFVYEPYSNVQSFDQFKASLEQFFNIDRCIPTSYQWHHQEPSRKINRAVQLRINVKVPVLSRFFAVEHFFVCSLKARGAA